ncbi:class I SAM-dependent methyltransferase [Hamadaea tsunoensis]|uniref:class I SAM-dependent methyltransferase n=1 Tax=Hamadaea tsunoensis TaxID=53368 RepID=UPI0004196BFF|nr:class I SAM-dependent methyltransferase [Hamadaea tsunoensis]
MTTIDTADTATIDTAAAVEQLAGRLFTSSVGALELFNVQLGVTLGLYREVVAAGPVTSAQLAAATGCDERYVREWCLGQATAGLLTADGQDPATARYAGTPGLAEVLLDELSPAYLAPLGAALAAVGTVFPALVEAFRTGDGVPYAAYGLGAVSAQAALNRPAYTHQLVAEWLPAVPDVAARLADAQRPPAVADLGCGAGWASIELAKAFGHLKVDGYDADEASIMQARTGALAAGVADRVHFEVCDLSSTDEDKPRYEIALMFECLHDMADPDGVLATTRAQMAPGGTLLIMEERADEAMATTEDPVQRFFAACSPLWCLPQGRIGTGAHPVGTMIRPAKVVALAEGAGFREVADIGIEHPFWRFFRATA